MPLNVILVVTKWCPKPFKFPTYGCDPHLEAGIGTVL